MSKEKHREWMAEREAKWERKWEARREACERKRALRDATAAAREYLFDAFERNGDDSPACWHDIIECVRAFRAAVRAEEGER